MARLNWGEEKGKCCALFLGKNPYIKGVSAQKCQKLSKRVN